MLIDESGLGRFFFYGLLPNETTLSYMRAVGKMRELLPAFANVRTLVVGRSMAQYKSFKGICTDATFIFRCFHVLRNVWYKASRLVGLSKYDKRQVHHFSAFLVFAYIKVNFYRFPASIARCTPKAMAYLSSTWILYKDVGCIQDEMGAILLDLYDKPRLK